MPAQIKGRQQDTVTLEIQVPLSRSLLDTEAARQTHFKCLGNQGAVPSTEYFSPLACV